MQKTAKLISLIFNPAIVGPAIFLILMYKFPIEGTWKWFYALITLIFHFFIPMVITYDFLRTGRIDDFDITKREQRNLITSLIDISLLIYFIISSFSPIPELYKIHALFALTYSWLFTLITFSWKISYHMGTLGWLAGAIFQVWGYTPVTVVVVFNIFMLTIWSRLFLGKHTFWQATIGFFLALGIYELFLFIY